MKMASGTTVALGFLCLAVLAYGYGATWLALGSFLLTLVFFVFGGGTETVKASAEVAAKAPVEVPKSMSQQVAEEEAKMATINDLRFRPSVPTDGLCGMNPMGKGNPVNIGQRSGTLAIDCGPVRFKDDIRFRLWAVEKDFFPGAKKLISWHFRTVKPVFHQKTKMLEATTESWDKELWDTPEWRHED